MPGAEVAQVILFPRPHPRLLFRAIHVIIAAEVEDTMRQQVGEFGIQGVAKFGRLPCCCRQRNRDVTKQRFIRHALHKIIRFIREGEDIRRLVDPEKLQIHPPDFIVICNQDRHAGPIGDAFAEHHPLGKVVQRSDVQRGLVQRDFDRDIVGDGVLPLLLREDFDGLARRGD